MNEGAVIEVPQHFNRREERDLPAAASNPMAMIAAAVQKGMDLETIKELRALQKDWEADEARKAFNNAFVAFKAEAIQVLKSRKVDAGPLVGKKYAELYAVVNAVTPALSRHGLSAAWKISKDEKEWIEVTCILKHEQGHSESVAMGGPPDTGGAKSPIQARASTVSYLERYTLKAICGISEQDDDKDGGALGMPDEEFQAFAGRIKDATTKEKAKAVWLEAVKACEGYKDRDAAEKLKAILIDHRKFIDSTQS